VRIVQVAPEQKRIAAALVLVALAAVGLTVWRCRHTSIVRAMSRAAPAVTRSASPRPVVTELPTGPATNPFRKPAWALTNTGADAAQSASATLPGPTGIPELPFPPMMVRPIGLERSPTATGAATRPANDEAAPPEFVLLTTARTSNRFCAAIRIGDSRVKVVQVGDIIGDGFKVKEITPDYVVLTNGADTRIARRRNANGSQSQQKHNNDSG